MAPRSPAELAHDAMLRFEREAHAARRAIVAVRDARATNDVARWSEAKARLESVFAHADTAHDVARSHLGDASPEVAEQVDAAVRELESSRIAARELGEPPRGFAPIGGETEILAIFAQPLDGGAKLGFERKEHALRDAFDRLAPADRRTLIGRLERARPNDPIAAAFARFTSGRRERLLAHLARPRTRQPPEVRQHAGGGPRAYSPALEADPTEPLPVDAKLRRVFEANDSDAAIAGELVRVAAELDGTERRALAKRLASYRPGCGDEVAARFARLERTVRAGICDAFEHAPVRGLQDPLRGELEAVTGTPLGHVQLHDGADGQAVAAAHHARAVTIGSDIYIAAGQPDATSAAGRELLAHEVAHVVQRVAAPAAKRDQAGSESTEVEADELASAYGKRGGAVRWQPGTGAPTGRAPETYLAKHQASVWRAVEDYLQHVKLPTPSPRLVWRGDTFVHATVAHLRAMDLFERHASLLEVLYPAAAYELIAPMLPPQQANDDPWVPTVGTALAQLFEQAIGASLRRLGPRWVELAEHAPEPEGVGDETKSLVAATSLIASSPIDIAVRRGLTDGAVVELTDTHKMAPRDGKRNELRPVSVEWIGDDPALWNWLRADPSDATPEEVAASLWHGSERAGWDGPTSYYAYGLVAAPPLFAMPPSWAKGFGRKPPAGASDESGAAQLAQLAHSKRADELALGQAAHEHRASRHADVAHLLEKLADSTTQLAYLETAFARWGMAGEVDVATRWVATKRAQVSTMSAAERTKWAPVIERQSARLYRIAEGVKPLAGSSKDASAHGDDAIRRVLTMYARAAETSFLADVSEYLIGKATSDQALLTLTALRATTNDLSLVVGDGRGMDKHDRATAEQLAASSRALQSKLLAGQALDKGELETTMLQSQRLALELRIDQLGAAVDEIMRHAYEPGISEIVGMFEGKYRSLYGFAADFKLKVDDVRSALHFEGLAEAQSRLKALRDDPDFQSFLANAWKIVEKHQTRTKWARACVQIVVLLGISMIASAAGATVARAVVAWGATAEAIEGAGLLARGAALVGRGAGLAVEATINTAGQRAVQGAPSDQSFLEGLAENGLMTLGSSAVLAKLGEQLEFAKDLATRTGSLWTKLGSTGAIALAKGVTISSHVLINAATSYVAQRVVEYAGNKGRSEASQTELAEWFLQGVSIGLGRYIHGQLDSRRGHYDKLAALHEFPAAKHLLRDADALLALAQRAEVHPDGAHAIELLARQRELLAEELQVLEAAHTDPQKRAALKLTDATVSAARQYVREQTAALSGTELAALPFQVAGLVELVPGEIWRGTTDEITRAFAVADRAKIPMTRARDGQLWTVKIGDHELHIQERTPEQQRAADREHEAVHGQAADPKATQLIGEVAKMKGFGEQHAHSEGSVPVAKVLAMVDEFRNITREQRAEQIQLLEDLIAESTAKGDAKVADLAKDKVDVQGGVVKARGKITIASVAGSLDEGLLNKMLKAKRALFHDPDDNGAKNVLNGALNEYRKTIGQMQKPDASVYDATVNTTHEFFVRYKMIVHHGLTPAEIAASRASAPQLAMQEFRFGTSELDAQRGKLEQEGVAHDASEAAALRRVSDQVLHGAPADSDVSLTLATTKNRIADPDAAKNEQQRMVEFVKTWEHDPSVQRAWNGLEAAGVEHAEKPPALLWEAAAQRAFRNAIRVREHLAEALRAPADVHALAERIGRVAGTSVDRAEALLQQYHSAGYEAAITATDQRAQALHGNATSRKVALPKLDPATQRIDERFAGLTIEDVARDTRTIVEALRTWSAETGVQHGDVSVLGMTMHAGEQLLNKSMDLQGRGDGPFALLDQVDQAVSLGSDRIGHALVLGIDPEVLVAKGVLPRSRVDEFRARQRRVIEHVRAAGVTIETNLSSNTEISNLTQGEHPAGRFVDEKVRVSVNTDDEAVLSTTIQREFERVSRAPGVTRQDLAAMILEAYRSRLGNRELNQRGRLKPQLLSALLTGLSRQEGFALAQFLADHFHVASGTTPRETIQRVLDVTLGL